MGWIGLSACRCTGTACQLSAYSDMGLPSLCSRERPGQWAHHQHPTCCFGVLSCSVWCPSLRESTLPATTNACLFPLSSSIFFPEPYGLLRWDSQTQLRCRGAAEPFPCGLLLQTAWDSHADNYPTISSSTSLSLPPMTSIQKQWNVSTSWQRCIKFH